MYLHYQIQTKDYLKSIMLNEIIYLNRLDNFFQPKKIN